ncbi:MAG: SDR family oxidoreductase [Gammaproteobacteria bacterium]|nr:SDR family oxidoreductase [Gammaproteobacteria bacterium]
MRILITGAGGFIGALLTERLLEQKKLHLDKKEHDISELVLIDQFPIKQEYNSAIQIQKKCIDISDKEKCNEIFKREFDVIFHLAAVVSSHAEQDFDLGYLVNVDATKNLLEGARRQEKVSRFFMTSSVAVFGLDLPEEIPDKFPALPLSSYGAQKAIAELLVSDYSRKGFCDGRVLRLPTVCVRPGKPNAAASSFVSSIIREPLNKESAICPVPVDLKLWIISPQTAVDSILHMVALAEEEIKNSRTLHPPGLTVSVQEILDELEKQAGDDVMQYIQYKRDQKVEDIVLTWPSRFASEQAKSLGFPFDQNIGQIIESYRSDKLEK